MPRTLGAAITACLLLLFFLGCVPNDQPRPQPDARKDDLGLSGALWTAVQECDLSADKELIRAGADVNLTAGPRASTPLMEAVGAYDNKCPRETAKLLIEAGAKLDLQDSHGDTALHWAAGRNCIQPYVDALNYLLSKGADPTIRNYQCQTALEAAAFQGCIDKMKPLADRMEKLAKEGKAHQGGPCGQKTAADKAAEGGSNIKGATP